ncbi:MAG: KAP family P-loop NTPase fold protein [Caulobacteraceae bacterium]
MKQLLIELEDKQTVKLPFFVLIDELDRCRPTYAIELLEQVKHLFDIDNTIFVIATDGDQLAHSISAVYGEQFDGKRYLLRFFHRHYRFEKRDLKSFTDYLFAANEIDLGKIATPWDTPPADLFVGAMQKYDLTLRDAEQCFDILRSAVTMWPHKVSIQLNVILPLIIHFQRHELNEFKSYFENRLAPPSASEWRVKYPYQSGRGERTDKFYAVEQLNSSLLGRMNTPLPDIITMNSNDSVSAYVREIFSSEFQGLYGGSWHGEPPRSVMNEYASLVRSVGRLAAPADNPNYQTVG